ncbi:MAG TPA: hypothetical protein VKG21_10255 [Casimicrobiaceae bacterium]|nr:hypothetical protein [Casimicrobiaceae bacterium]
MNTQHKNQGIPTGAGRADDTTIIFLMSDGNKNIPYGIIYAAQHFWWFGRNAARFV